MFIFKLSLAECQGRWRDIPWGVHKSYIQVFVVFIALSEHSCTLLLAPWLRVSPNGAYAALHVQNCLLSYPTRQTVKLKNSPD